MISVSSFPVIHHTSPVVLVHGWRSGPWIFKRLIKRLHSAGIETWIFDYSRESHKNPVELAPTLSQYIQNMREETGYEGSIDLISHSMGAMLSRYYCEVSNRSEGEHRIGKWIGIAPVNHGAPVADIFVRAREEQYTYCCQYPVLPPDIKECMQDGAIVGNMPNGPHVLEMRKAGLCSQVQYYVIAGHNPTQEYRFWPTFAGQTIATVQGRYVLTYNGDGMVPNEHSFLEGHPFILLSANQKGDLPPELFNHNGLVRCPAVFDEILNILIS